MKTVDWLVIGNGLTGAALGYELARRGCSVLLLEKSSNPESATRYSYGGIPYWSGDTDLLRQLCREGLARHHALPDETATPTEFRELDLLLAVAPDCDPNALASRYAAVEIPPVPISAQEAAEREPQLDPGAIAGALVVRHGHVSPTALVGAYNRGLEAAGGRIEITTAMRLVRTGNRITGAITPAGIYEAGNVAIAAGGFTRDLLKTADVRVPVYFTHAEIVETPPLEIDVRALVMPADLSRSGLELGASDIGVDALWDEADREIVPPILDVGCIQFRDRTMRIGQISRINTSLAPSIDAAASERHLRQGIAPLVPALAEVTGQWRACPVAFSRDGLPLVGSVPGLEGVAVFSGFNSPFALVPAAAVWFARWATGETVPELAALAPARFMTA